MDLGLHIDLISGAQLTLDGGPSSSSRGGSSAPPQTVDLHPGAAVAYKVVKPCAKDGCCQPDERSSGLDGFSTCEERCVEQLARHAEDAYTKACRSAGSGRPTKLQWLLSEQESTSQRGINSTARPTFTITTRARNSSDFKALDRMTSFGAIFKAKP